MGANGSYFMHGRRNLQGSAHPYGRQSLGGGGGGRREGEGEGGGGGGGRGQCIHGETYRPALKKKPFEVKELLILQMCKGGHETLF